MTVRGSQSQQTQNYHHYHQALKSPFSINFNKKLKKKNREESSYFKTTFTFAFVFN